MTLSHGAKESPTPERLSDSQPVPLQTEEDNTDLSAHKLLAQKHSRRENVRDKAKRLLVSGRLRVIKVDGNLIVAECRGDSGEIYKLGYDPKKQQYRCTCPSRGPCSHEYALWAVTAVER
jgi:uncharacterized Zn finger protein